MRISDWSSDVCSSDLMAVIDVGLKSEGRVALREFAAPGQKADLKIGDEVAVYVDRVENASGEAMLSRDRARRAAAWDNMETEFTETARVAGRIFARVTGGLPADVQVRRASTRDRVCQYE